MTQGEYQREFARVGALAIVLSLAAGFLALAGLIRLAVWWRLRQRARAAAEWPGALAALAADFPDRVARWGGVTGLENPVIARAALESLRG
jgi:hypothetical protein